MHNNDIATHLVPSLDVHPRSSYRYICSPAVIAPPSHQLLLSISTPRPVSKPPLINKLPDQGKYKKENSINETT